MTGEVTAGGNANLYVPFIGVIVLLVVITTVILIIKKVKQK